MMVKKISTIMVVVFMLTSLVACDDAQTTDSYIPSINGVPYTSVPPKKHATKEEKVYLEKNNLTYPITAEMLGDEVEGLDTGEEACKAYDIKGRENEEIKILKDYNNDYLYFRPRSHMDWGLIEK